MSGDFRKAVEHSWNWLRDEPFATRAALFGSWIAGTAIGDHALSLSLTEAAWQANPGDPRLIAQLVYEHASLGDPSKAQELLRQLPTAIRQHPTVRPQVAWDVLTEADKGLIAFRRGTVESGRAHYRAAVELAAANNLREMAALAALTFAREESRLDPAYPGLAELVELVKRLPEPMRHVYSAFAARIPQIALR